MSPAGSAAEVPSPSGWHWGAGLWSPGTAGHQLCVQGGRWHHMRTEVQMKSLQPDPFPFIIRAIRGEQYIWSCNCCSSHIQLIVWHIHENSVCHDICRLISNPGNSPEQIMYVCVYVSTLYLLLSNSPSNSNPWCFKSLSPHSMYQQELVM